MERQEGYVGLHGRRFAVKPEDWTHLTGKVLVPKDHPRILFRGQVDLLQARVIVVQNELARMGADPRLADDLQSVVELLRQVSRCEVLDEPLPELVLIGLTAEELRAQSHDPQGVFGVEQMKLPDRALGYPYALLNELRAQARVCETAAAAAFRPRPTAAQQTVLRAMNRLSSALHILMCRVLAGQYGA